MNYMSLIGCDTANGNGVRVSLFVSGCEHKCPGCFNPESHDPNAGKPFDDSVKQKIFAELGKDYCTGLSLLGGDPLSKYGDIRKTVIQLCKEVKEKFPNKDIWIWTGSVLEDIKCDDEMKDILKYVDVLVDGPFIEEQKDLSIPFRGSSNQRILYKGKDF